MTAGEITPASLEELALNVRSSWNHRTDELWARLDPELWALTHNPWAVLQTVSQARLKQVLAEPAYRERVASLLRRRREYLDAAGWFQESHPGTGLTGVAYFSMEFGLSEALPLGDAYEYSASIPASRPAVDYTPRLVPRHLDALVPLEAAEMLWER